MQPLSPVGDARPAAEQKREQEHRQLPGRQAKAGKVLVGEGGAPAQHRQLGAGHELHGGDPDAAEHHQRGGADVAQAADRRAIGEGEVRDVERAHHQGVGRHLRMAGEQREGDGRRPEQDDAQANAMPQALERDQQQRHPHHPLEHRQVAEVPEDEAAERERHPAERRRRPRAADGARVGVDRQGQASEVSDHQQVQRRQRRQHEEQPGGRIEHAGLHRGEEGHAAEDTRVPQRQHAGRHLLGEHTAHGQEDRQRVAVGEQDRAERAAPPDQKRQPHQQPGDQPIRAPHHRNGPTTVRHRSRVSGAARAYPQRAITAPRSRASAAVRVRRGLTTPGHRRQCSRRGRRPAASPVAHRQRPATSSRLRSSEGLRDGQLLRAGDGTLPRRAARLVEFRQAPVPLLTG